MTIIEYVLAQMDARKRREELGKLPTPVHLRLQRISIAGDLGGRAYTPRDARRKWARAA